jgi:hypothetical protein
VSLEESFAAAEQSQSKLLEATIRHTRNADREVARAVREARDAVDAKKQAEHERDLLKAEVTRYIRTLRVLNQLIKSGPISRDELARHLSVLEG